MVSHGEHILVFLECLCKHLMFPCISDLFSLGETLSALTFEQNYKLRAHMTAKDSISTQNICH